MLSLVFAQLIGVGGWSIDGPGDTLWCINVVAGDATLGIDVGVTVGLLVGVGGE